MGNEGSRAWGFSSRDSDYDVRFIYARPFNTYLSVKDSRDVVETLIAEDDLLGVPFDMNGWDLRKALQLALKPNAVLNEWLCSPILYRANAEFAKDLRALMQQTFNPAAYIYHYDRLARTAFEKISENPEDAKSKQYCYALRCALSIGWIEENQTPPPMDVPSLITLEALSQDVKGAIENLIARKKNEIESDMMPRDVNLDIYLQKTLAPKREKPEPITTDAPVLADEIFRRYIRE